MAGMTGVWKHITIDFEPEILEKMAREWTEKLIGWHRFVGILYDDKLEEVAGISKSPQSPLR